MAHLERYGLKSKPPEAVEGGHVLGLQLSQATDGTLQFRRGNELPKAGCQRVSLEETALLNLW